MRRIAVTLTVVTLLFSAGSASSWWSAEASDLAPCSVQTPESSSNYLVGFHDNPIQKISVGNITALVVFNNNDADTTNETEAAELRAREAELTVVVDGKVVAAVRETYNFFPPVLRILELDPCNPFPEVVLFTHPGGNHSQHDLRIVTSDQQGDNWGVVLTTSDNEPYNGGEKISALEDLDQDGVYEIITRVDIPNFYGCMACRHHAVAIKRLQGRQIVDVSRNREFRQFYEQIVGELEVSLGEFIETGDPNINVFLPAYLVTKIIFGEGQDAWSRMLQSFSRSNRDGLPENGSVIDYPKDLKSSLLEIGLVNEENEHLFNLPGVIVCQHIDYDDIRMEVLSIEGCSEGWRLSPSGN